MKHTQKRTCLSGTHRNAGLWVLYDLATFIGIAVVYIFGLKYTDNPTPIGRLIWTTAIVVAEIFFARVLWKVYAQVWRYGGVQTYLRLIFGDACGLLASLATLWAIRPRASLVSVMAFVAVDCLAVLSVRMFFRYAYKTGRFSRLLRFFSAGRVEIKNRPDQRKIKIAIVGAGRVGVSLAEDLMNNAKSAYAPVCFVEINSEKVGRSIHDIPVYSEEDVFPKLKSAGVQEIVLALPQLSAEEKKAIYQRYADVGYKIKVYDYASMQATNGKRILREFDAEELLFRKPIIVTNEKTEAYYKGKVVLITGGGGSIGSELCRQIAKMAPKQLIILDVYENGAYEVQQELKMLYGTSLDVKIVIVSVCNEVGLERTFRKYRPQIVINAAAHKHVPLMEDDCIEAVENNVFGTLNSVTVAEKYGAERFIMVSTDKAVNPTNVMGATKRMCEMIVLNHKGNMTCSATRFGNVLGSAGSVIPLFKRQIAAGGPVTVTDKRIIRYFMTIPEAAQLVLQSGSMAKDKELFVLDMGQPVKILDLAENMIRLSGQTDVEIVETGLRPGEKLYEELLVRTEELDRTDNDLIFVERDKLLDPSEIDEKLEILRAAVATGDDLAVKAAMKRVVPTYKDPKDVPAKTAEELENAITV